MKTTYVPTIGLEIHAELKTQTKMFCSSKNDPEEKKPNVNICPVCMGHPGTLPVINKEAVKHVLRVGVAVGGRLADFTEFDRKNYFYPDLSKGYQISQYKYPLVSGGSIGDIAIERVHLEEDTARSTHDTGDYSLIDFNRAGVPLMELVTKPVVENAENAVFFAREFQLLLRYLGASDANMEKGEMRVEANISVSDTDKMGTKVEVKNLNSFKAVSRAIAYEIKRQSKLLDKGEKIVQETRGWDENKDKTFSQRIKEESHDYRYFPEPDLPKLYISEIPEFSKETLKKEIQGKLPQNAREKYREMGLGEDIIEIFVYEPKRRGLYFKIAIGGHENNKGIVREVANYVVVEIADLMKEKFKQKKEKTGTGTGVSWIIDSSLLQKLPIVADKKIKGEISSRIVKDTLAAMIFDKRDPEEFLEEKGTQQSDEGELLKIVEKIIADKPQVVADFKGGKEQSLQFLIGQGMQATGGSANPAVLKKLFLESLHKS